MSRQSREGLVKSQIRMVILLAQVSQKQIFHSLLRQLGAKVGALTGTLITNPVSIVFIYPAQCWVGSRAIGRSLSWETVTDAMGGVLANQDWAALMKLSGDLIASFFVGGFLLAAVATPIAYFAVLAMVRSYRRRTGESDC